MKNYFAGFLTCLSIVIALSLRYFWPAELSLVFNELFVSAVLLLLTSVMIVGYLYRTRGASTRGALFSLSLLLILSASLMYSGFEEIARNAQYWEPHLKSTYPKLFVVLPVIFAYTKNVISFGFAAIGASLAASVIVENPRTFKQLI